MRFVHVLWQYMKGIRLLAFVLFLLMLWAIICGVVAYGKIQNIQNDLKIVASCEPENAYLLSYFFNAGLQIGASKTETTINALKENAAVEQVMSISVANPVSYQGTGISIVLYDPALLAFFPALADCGINFEKYPDGCILASRLFGSLNTGDTVNLSFFNKEKSFSIAGRLDNPYRQLTLSVSSSAPVAGDLFIEADAVIMQATPVVLEQLEPLVKRIEMDTNLIVVFKDGTTRKEQAAVLSAVASDYQHASFTEIIGKSKEKVRQTLIKELPQPLFLAIMAFVSFFSILILVFKKKSKSLAVFYLCGYSRNKCGLLAFAAAQVFLLLPVLFGVCFIAVWPQLNWMNLVQLAPQWYGLWALLETITVNTACLWVVVWYYLITTLCAVTVTVANLSRCTPVTYLRRA